MRVQQQNEVICFQFAIQKTPPTATQRKKNNGSPPSVFVPLSLPFDDFDDESFGFGFGERG